MAVVPVGPVPVCAVWIIAFVIDVVDVVNGPITANGRKLFGNAGIVGDGAAVPATRTSTALLPAAPPAFGSLICTPTRS